MSNPTPGDFTGHHPAMHLSEEHGHLVAVAQIELLTLSAGKVRDVIESQRR